jgi:Sulfotransferase family
MTASAEAPMSKGESADSRGAAEVTLTATDALTPAGVNGSNRRLPEFFVVGHPKCGTSAMCMMLMQHPQVYLPVKEPRFFVPEQRSRFRQANSRERPDTLDDYLSLFSDAAADQRVGEASTSYLRSEQAAKRIAELQPEARIIAVLREPASFLRSLHLQYVHNHVETVGDFRKAITLEEQRRTGRHIPRLSQAPQRLMYSENVNYVEQLRRFHQVFPREQVLVLIYDDFRADNLAGVREVLRFLDLDDEVPIKTMKNKPLRAIRFQFLHQAVRAISIAHRNPRAAGPLSQAINLLTPAEVRNERLLRLWRRVVYRDPPPSDEQFMLELRRRYRPEVQALSEYLGRDLVALWGYDKID